MDRLIIYLLRYLLPICALLINVGCFLPLILSKKSNVAYYLKDEAGKKTALNAKQLLVGSDDSCDIVFGGLRGFHFVLNRKNNGYTVSPYSTAVLKVDGNKVIKEMALLKGDVISAGGRELCFERRKVGTGKNKTGAVLPFLSLLIFQFFMAVGLFAADANGRLPALSLLAFIVAEIIYFAIVKGKGCFIETAVLFDTTVGLSVAARVSSFAFLKQLFCFCVGAVFAFALYKIITKKELAYKLKIPVLILGAALFVFNIVLGEVRGGSQNWISLGVITVQPAEFVKIFFVFLGGVAAIARQRGKTAVLYFCFAAFSFLSLAYVRDFGAAAIFFVTFISVLLLIRVKWQVVAATAVGAVAAAAAAAIAFPYVAKRLFYFGSAWENVYRSGYQQVKNMVAAANGGLFGRGLFEGSFGSVAAADTDLVFGMIAEELGLIIALLVAVSFGFILYYMATKTANSYSFCSVTGLSAAVMLTVQAALNIFGSLDMLPFTGVTLPFVSNGGSSMISCVIMLGFIKAGENEEGIT